MKFYCSSAGISRKRDVQLSKKDFVRGTITFRAPEVEYFSYLETKRQQETTVPTLTTKVDVYAFAMIMYILLYGNRLWHLGGERSKRGLVADKKCNRPPLGDRTVLGDEAPRFSSPETIENWKNGGLCDNFAPTRCSPCMYKAWNGQTNEWEAGTTATASSVEYMTPHTEDYINLM